ncbi:uncharacterized protein [Amphiura filiformis]|uniref:uncharacterized protein n=1 Tax=Amphiura filiformis TaxID=82378 RepID=UPI003B214768
MLTMAFWKRRSGTFEPRKFGSKNCKYGAYYLGKMETDGESGLDCTLKTVNNMYKNYKQSKGKNAQRMVVEVAREGVIMCNEASSPPNGVSNGSKTLLPVVDISFGTAVPGHDKVFAVVVRTQPTPGSCRWYCHGFLCDSPSVARDLTLLLVKAFQRASAAGEIDQPTSVDEATRQSKPTTLHILHERGRLEHQKLHKSKSTPAVSAIRVTLNVEYKKPPVQEQPKPKSKAKGKKSKEVVDGNRAFAEALAKRDFEKDKLGLLDKPVKKREGGTTATSSSSSAATSSTHVPLRRSKSDSEALKAGMAKLADDKENLDLSSESDKDNISDNDSSTHNGSSELEDDEQEIVVAINPLMSILKNPASPLKAGSTTTVAFRGEVSSPRSESDDEESPDKDGSKRAKRKSVRFSEDFAVIPDS